MNEKIMSNLYTEEINKLIGLHRAMDKTRNYSVLILAGMAYFAFGLPQTSSHLILILGSLIIFLFQVFEARTSQFAATSDQRIREIEKNFLAPSIDPTIKPEEGWEKRITAILSEYKSSKGFVDAFAERVWKNYFIIFLTLDICWFSKLYLFPQTAQNWIEFIHKLDFGALPGWFFLVFAGAFWITYTVLAIMYHLKNKGKEIRY